MRTRPRGTLVPGRQKCVELARLGLWILYESSLSVCTKEGKALLPALSEAIKQTRIFQRISVRQDYINTIESLRNIAEVLGRQIEHLVPDYTDHSIRHMDALWSVASVLLTAEETDRCRVEELFLLCCTFYVHDLGMAIACTKEGVERLRSTAEYKALLGAVSEADPMQKARREVLALRSAARTMHAAMAPALMLEPIPGLNRYLIEDTEMRENWGALIGEIASSHHWSLQQLESRLGRRGEIPTVDGGSADLGYIACLLRTSDYAHINRERALKVERQTRTELSQDSSLHWDAQANVTGPTRDRSQLVYSCTAAITSIDAWWLFYDMALGLDTEIRMVRDYLESRKVSAGRFSLQGVRGAESPESFASYVTLNSEIAPIDVRVQPHSMERVIDILGGPALYRGDPLAPIRELIQNCRDAIALRNALETVSHQDLTPGKLEISLDVAATPPTLKVRDNGVGMTRSIVKNHLISVASNFWTSMDYARDFSRVAEAGFSPIGRFGIGFLSVFMLGSYIEVETERAGSPRVLLRLRGIGRRGELVEKIPTGRIGTEVRIHLSEAAAKSLAELPEIVKARAPMLPFEIRTELVSTEGTKRSTILPRWWANASSSELYKFLANWGDMARLGRVPDDAERRLYQLPRYMSRRRAQSSEKSAWPGEKPDFTEETGRVIDSGKESAFGVLHCSHGIAIDVHSAEHGLFGLVETGEVGITPDRSTVLGYERNTYTQAMNRLIQGLTPRVQEAVDGLERFGSIPARQTFLRELAQQYGADLLAGSSLRWIPTLEQPGNLIHRSSGDLKGLLEPQPSVVICSGLSPGKAYDLAAQRLESAELNRCLHVLLPNNEFRADFELEKKLEVQEGSSRLRGTFEQIIDKANCKKEQFLLLGILLDVVSEAWSIPRTSLEAQPWEMDVDYSAGYLWVNLRRP